MGCSACASSNGSPNGCKNNGHCQSGGCNKMNTFDWLADMEIYDPNPYNIVEISFKKGARKDFFANPYSNRIHTGDIVVVDMGTGHDVGQISLSGELVRLQLRKKKISEDRVFHSVIRKANERDLERLEEARNLEKKSMVRARVIARMLDLDMKIGDVEYQGDKRKATFYYTADGRVDFRELVRNYAKEFKVKIEMRQIGSRQESARIGGIGSCGRELCCSTWLSDFRSVSTTAARYQNIAINQSKLSGQCGRLKCCLNYELDSYMDALSGFPDKAERLKTKKGSAVLVKMDIFKGIMFYSYEGNGGRHQLIALDKDRVKEIKELNQSGQFPEELKSFSSLSADFETQTLEFADVTGEIELPPTKKRRSKRRGKNSRNRPSNRNPRRSNPRQGNKSRKTNNNKGKSNNKS